MGTEVTSLLPIRSSPIASELRMMPKDRRDAIMEGAAMVADELYRNDPSLPDFEAFEVDGIHGDGEATSEVRFVRFPGSLDAGQVDETASAVALCVEAP